MSNVILDSGTVGTTLIWIGCSREAHDFGWHPVSGEEMHIFKFTPDDAKAAIQMLQDAIDRLESSQTEKAG